MIEEGRAYSVAVALEHLLPVLERKAVMTEADTTNMLDAVIAELRDLKKRDVLSPTASSRGPHYHWRHVPKKQLTAHRELFSKKTFSKRTPGMGAE